MVIDLAGLTTSGQGFRLIGDAAYDAAGQSVASAGDINGDGYDDFIIGAHANDAAGSNAGAAYVIFGKAGGFADIDLGNIAAGAGFSIIGAAANDHTGVSVSSAGDINGDGFDDIIVGGYNDPGGTAGAAYVLFGKASGFTDIDLANLDPAAGFTITGAAQGDSAGIGVSSAGDVNGDGFDDIIVGAPNVGQSTYPYHAGIGAAYVIYGKESGFADINLGALSPADGFKILGDGALDSLGRAVSSAGDVNGDGFDDILVGAYLNDAGGTNSGAAYVIFGKESGLTDVNLATLGSADGFRIAGDAAFDYSAKSVSSAGDINGDGFDDIIFGASGNDANGSAAGAAYVIYGKATGFTNIDLAALTSADGFRIIGAAVNDYTGLSVSSAGDVNGDGFDDVIVGAPLNDGSGRTDAGASWVIYGKAGGISGIDVRTLSDADGFKITGASDSDGSGFGVAGAGDVNGDGFADLIIGASINDAGGTDAGAAYVVFGHGPTEAVSRIGSQIGQTIHGSAFDDTLDGRGGDDFLYASGGSDTVIGGAGNDLLDGGTGADSLIGGTGNDTYVIDNVNDVVVERVSEGTDTIVSSFTYTLGSFVEKLTLTGTAAINGTGNALANTITGNSAANVITGGGGFDVLSGGAGNDHLNGGDGNDILDGGAGDDVLAGNAGVDTASYAAATAGVTVDLGLTIAQATGAGKDTLSGIENLTGSSHNDRLTGNALANAIVGGAGNDALDGGAGGDTLTGGIGTDRIDGGIGNDTLAGGAGPDSFVFSTALNASTNADKITDFSVADDTILLSSTIFAAAGPSGTLSASAFHVGSAAADADDRIIYSQATGQIYYDADGTGAGAKVLFAKVTAGTVLTNLDFSIYLPPAAAVATQASVASDGWSADRIGHFAGLFATLEALDHQSLSGSMFLEQHTAHHFIVSPSVWQLHGYSDQDTLW